MIASWLPPVGGAWVFLSTVISTYLSKHYCDLDVDPNNIHCTSWSISHSIGSPPAKWIFLTCVVMSVLLIAPVYWALYKKETRHLRWATVQLIVGLFGGVGMVLLVVLDIYTFPSWHYVFAIIFFVCMLAHMILSVLFHYWTSREIPTMRVCLCFVNVVMAVFVGMSDGETALFGKYEWVFMSTFCLYIASLYVDMTTKTTIDTKESTAAQARDRVDLHHIHLYHSPVSVHHGRPHSRRVAPTHYPIERHT